MGRLLAVAWPCPTDGGVILNRLGPRPTRAQALVSTPGAQGPGWRCRMPAGPSAEILRGLQELLEGRPGGPSPRTRSGWSQATWRADRWKAGAFAFAGGEPILSRGMRRTAMAGAASTAVGAGSRAPDHTVRKRSPPIGRGAGLSEGTGSSPSGAGRSSAGTPATPRTRAGSPAAGGSPRAAQGRVRRIRCSWDIAGVTSGSRRRGGRSGADAGRSIPGK